MPLKKLDNSEEQPKKKVVVIEELAPTPETNLKETTISENVSVPEPKPEPVAVPEIEKESKSVDALINLPAVDDEEKPNYLWIIIPTALLVGVLVGGLITYFSGISKFDTVEPKVTATPKVEVEKTATPVPQVTTKREDLKVQVLNGSGVSGLASKAKTLLEGLGYKDVAVGNADKSDYEETQIQIKDSVKDFVNVLTSDLSKSYTVSKESKTLSSTSKFDIIITLGKK